SDALHRELEDERTAWRPTQRGVPDEASWRGHNPGGFVWKRGEFAVQQSRPGEWNGGLEIGIDPPDEGVGVGDLAQPPSAERRNAVRHWRGRAPQQRGIWR